jgi:outer membrane protein
MRRRIPDSLPLRHDHERESGMKARPVRAPATVGSRRRNGLLALHALCLGLVALLPGPTEAQVAAKPTRVGVVLDDESAMARFALNVFRREVTSFFGGDGLVAFDDRRVLAADGTLAGARAALDSLFADSATDLVVALGPIASQEVAHRAVLAKPTVALVIVDARLQGLPSSNGSTGIHNLTYIDAAYPFGSVLEQFHGVVPFRSLALLVHPGLLDAIPVLRQEVQRQAGALGFEANFVPVTGSGPAAIERLPAGTDAVYLGPLDGLEPASYDSLVSALTARRLPTMSVLGRSGVERGVLVGFAPAEELERRARRTAVDIQRIRAGEDAAALPVGLAAVPELTINMATARAMGFSPGWQVLIEADLINELPPPEGPTWSIAGAAREAIRVHSDVRAAERYVAAGGEQTRRARSALLPQVTFSTTGTIVREETAAASFGLQPERQLSGGLGLSQVLISDEARAGFDIAGRLEEGRSAALRRTEMDVALDAATAYLTVLRAQAQARVWRANLRRTRANLELAQLREMTGSAGLADVYRWQSELARARQAVLNADAQLRIAEVGFNRDLERPLEERFTLADVSPSDSSFLTSDPRLFDYMANPESFRVFRDFMVREAVAASPELRELDASIAAQNRSLTAASRGLWWPTLSLQASLNRSFARGGAGTDGLQLPAGLPTLPNVPNATWSLRFQLSRPVFTGLEREAARAQARAELERLSFMRASLQRSIDQQMLVRLHLASASWSGIQQARDAADAARHNLDLITDAYSRGAVAVISLIDAQQSALNAEQNAADAVYAFLSDLLRAERAAGEFQFFRSAEARAEFFGRLDAFFRAAGVQPGQARRP